MIIGHGIDIVEINRFEQWRTFCRNHLLKLFSPQEITYCLSEPSKSAERFAARFAAKEALFKALHQALPDFSMPFFSLCKKAWVDSSAKVPKLVLEFELPSDLIIKLSLSHSKLSAIASVIIYHRS